MKNLRSGVTIGGEHTLPAEVQLFPTDPGLWPKRTPIRFRKTVPTAWLEITLREGKNRQVRRMTAAAGHPAVRVVRTAIGPLILDDLRPGESRPLTRAEARVLAESVQRRAPQRS